MTTTGERLTYLRETQDALRESVGAGLDLLFMEAEVESDNYLDLVRFDIQTSTLRSIDISLERLRIAIENLR